MSTGCGPNKTNRPCPATRRHEAPQALKQERLGANAETDAEAVLRRLVTAILSRIHLRRRLAERLTSALFIEWRSNSTGNGRFGGGMGSRRTLTATLT